MTLNENHILLLTAVGTGVPLRFSDQGGGWLLNGFPVSVENQNLFYELEDQGYIEQRWVLSAKGREAVGKDNSK